MSHDRAPAPAGPPPLYGVMGEFATPRDLLHAAGRLRARGYKKIEAYTPFPIHGLDTALGHSGSKVPWIVLGGAFLGGGGGLWLQWWTSAVSYPIRVGGKPFFSVPAFVPITFELGVLFSAFAAILGMLALNRLPQPYHPVFTHSQFHRATDDRFFLAIEANDPQFNVEKAEHDLADAGGAHIEVLQA
jgi:ActD protein